MARRNEGGLDALYIIGAILALTLVIVAAVVALATVGADSRATPAITTLLGFLGTTVAALLALLAARGLGGRVDGVEKREDRVERRVDTIEEAAYDRGILNRRAARRRKGEGD